MEGLSEALALAVPKTGVRVTLVEPGATQTAALQRALQMLEQVMRASGCVHQFVHHAHGPCHWFVPTIFLDTVSIVADCACCVSSKLALHSQGHAGKLLIKSSWSPVCVHTAGRSARGAVNTSQANLPSSLERLPANLLTLQAREDATAAEEKDPYTKMLDAYAPTLEHLLQQGGATPPDKVGFGTTLSQTSFQLCCNWRIRLWLVGFLAHIACLQVCCRLVFAAKIAVL